MTDRVENENPRSGQSVDATDRFLCVTCGMFQPPEKFEEGDCTCHDCNANGRTGNNYDLNDDGQVVEAAPVSGGEAAR